MGVSNDRSDTISLRSFGAAFDSPEFYLGKLEEALAQASGEPLHFAELLRRLSTIWTDDDRQLVLGRIEQLAPEVPNPAPGPPLLLGRRQLPEDKQERLTQVLAELVEQAEHLPACDRNLADRAVARLSRLLSPDRAWSVVAPWFGDHRAFRRQTVTRILLDYDVPNAFAEQIILQYRATLDRGLLKLIARHPHVAALLEEDDVVRALAAPALDYEIGPFVIENRVVGPVVHRDRDARYWWMRAIEAYLIGGHVPRDAIAFDHPMEFAWAVGRQVHRPSLPLLKRVLEHYQADPEFVWRCMLALQRVGNSADIEHVRAVAAALVATESFNRSVGQVA